MRLWLIPQKHTSCGDNMVAYIWTANCQLQLCGSILHCHARYGCGTGALVESSHIYL